jgi:hypothetical protein
VARRSQVILVAEGIAGEWWVHQDDSGIGTELPDLRAILLADGGFGKEQAENVSPDWIDLVEIEPLASRTHAASILFLRWVPTRRHWVGCQRG